MIIISFVSLIFLAVFLSEGDHSLIHISASIYLSIYSQCLVLETSLRPGRSVREGNILREEKKRLGAYMRHKGVCSSLQGSVANYLDYLSENTKVLATNPAIDSVRVM